MMKLPVIIEQLSLQNQIEQFINSNTMHGLTCMDSIIEFCSFNNIDVETAAAAILSNQNLVERLRIEAESLNFLEKQARLPI
jgi:uncharacterized protein YPO0396